VFRPELSLVTHRLCLHQIQSEPIPTNSSSASHLSPRASSSCRLAHVGRPSLTPPPVTSSLTTLLPVVPRSTPPPSTCHIADQDAFVELDSLPSSSQPRRTTPGGASAAAALGHGSGNRRWGRRVFFPYKHHSLPPHDSLPI
jgi:hypothetical protein